MKIMTSALAGASLYAIAASLAAMPAYAADPAPTSSAAHPASTLEEIVVTAQRREENVQDVPIAVSSLTRSAMATNRVVTVTDLNLLVPGMTVEPSAGGIQIPSFSMRGVTSYGVVPGSDKTVSIYIDGVYLANPRGSIFDLPDVSQIDVLRGPQGTLFGRNATAGAVSITTRNPAGKFGIQQSFTVGNEDQFRSRTTVDLPAWGPFSAYVSYVHNYQRGDIRNAGAGTVWDYSNATTSLVPKTEVSPKWLGTTNSNTVFAAVKFEPNDSFNTIYKFDYSKDNGTPTGVAFLGAGPIFAGLVAIEPNILTATAKRPDVVNNSFTTPSIQTNLGHSLTSVYSGENFTIKNIAAYRESFVFASDQYDGLGGLLTPNPAPPLGGPYTLPFPFIATVLTDMAQARQWSDELQYVYRSKLMTLTVGGIVFEGKDSSGGVPGLPNDLTEVAFVPTNKIPSGTSVSYNKQDSIAAYGQIELHLTPNIDIVGGMRETKDWKSGNMVSTPALPSFDYVNTRPTYLIGVNYKPTDDLLLYGKYSTAFVSGGSVVGIPFQPETVASWEIGFKGEFFDRHLRTNVALYDATYQHLQDAEGGGISWTGTTLAATYPQVLNAATFVIDQGGQVQSDGVEFEGSWLVGHGVTVGSNVSYQHTTYHDPSPLSDQTGLPPIPTLLPTWTVGLFGNYTKNFSNGLKGTLSMNANWRTELPFLNPALSTVLPGGSTYLSSPATWVVNGRAVLSGFRMHGVNAEVALWGKNITDDRSLISDGVNIAFASGQYQPARTFGLDVNFKY